MQCLYLSSNILAQTSACRPCVDNISLCVHSSFLLKISTRGVLGDKILSENNIQVLYSNQKLDKMQVAAEAVMELGR
jgi:predicted acetyltransferase